MKDIRSWATPLTIGAFSLTAVTGIMLFFNLAYGLIKPAHEWLSWLFVIGSIFHIQANWRVFSSYFSKPLGRNIIVTFLVLLGIAFLPIGGHPESPVGRMSKLVSALPLETVAIALKEPPEQLASRISARGLRVNSSKDTLADIAASNSLSSMHLLRIVLD